MMGRNSEFIAMHSALSSCVADLCLVLEVDFKLDGPDGGRCRRCWPKTNEGNRSWG